MRYGSNITISPLRWTVVPPLRQILLELMASNKDPLLPIPRFIKVVAIEDVDVEGTLVAMDVAISIIPH